MERPSQHLYEFGPYRLDTAERLLLRDGQRVTLTPKVFETLVVLVERRGRLVGKEELLQTVWPDTFVEEGNLTNNVSTLRKILSEGQNGLVFIETVPKRGYRFAAAVRELQGQTTDVILERHTFTRVETEEDEQTAQWTKPEPSHEPLTKWRAPIATAALCLLAAAGLIAGNRYWSARTNVLPGANTNSTAPLRSIAVMPFKTLGTEGDSEYLSLGMNEALVARLGNLRQLIVRPASAMHRYSDGKPDAIAAGREQGVDAVLDGTVQRAGDHIRVTVQLLRVADQGVLWSGQFDERLTDIFAVQDSISKQVAQGLMLKLNDEERGRLQKRGYQNVEAYQAYLRGRYFWNKRNKDGYEKAVEHFNRAIEIDPAYAQAYAGLADATLFLGGNTRSGVKEAQAKGRAALKKALEIDETLAEPHATLGLLSMNLDWNWQEAEREYKRAIELNPNYATAHHWYGEFLAGMGRFDEAMAEIERAQELDPLSLIISTDTAKIAYMSRQYDRAIEQCRKTLEMDPHFSIAHVWLGFSYSAKGRHEEAITEFHKIKDQTDDPMFLSYLGYVYGAAGQKEAAQNILRRLTALSSRSYVSPYSMVLVHLGLGDKDEVFKWYERVFDEHNIGVLDLKTAPGFDSLRSDARYDELLRRANFTE